MRLPLTLSALLSSLAAQPTLALSCKEPNFADRFNEAAAAEEVYALFLGTLTPMVEPTDLTGTMSAPFRLEGRQLGRAGFGETTAIDVLIERTCAGSSCGPFPPADTPLLALVEQRGAAMVITADPCSTDISPTPGFGRVAAIRACMRALDCGPSEIDAFAGP